MMQRLSFGPNEIVILRRARNLKLARLGEAIYLEPAGKVLADFICVDHSTHIVCALACAYADRWRDGILIGGVAPGGDPRTRFCPQPIESRHRVMSDLLVV